MCIRDRYSRSLWRAVTLNSINIAGLYPYSCPSNKLTWHKIEYIEVDTTYTENTDLPYLLNVTAFDYTVMRWIAVARIHSNKENSEFYACTFKAVFDHCKEDHKEFAVGKTLKGIIMDWSDTERAGLQTAIGQDSSEKLVGCRVHYG